MHLFMNFSYVTGKGIARLTAILSGIELMMGSQNYIIYSSCNNRTI